MGEYTKERVATLIPKETLLVWEELTDAIDLLYDMDRLWNKGFGMWEIEYKYRRGGKTLCTFYAKEGTATLLITYGKTEREKFEENRMSFSPMIQTLYDQTETYHDGKWLWIPIDAALQSGEILAMLKLKRRPNRK